MKLKKIIPISLIAAFLYSCSGATYPPTAAAAPTPNIGVPLTTNSLEITAPNGWNTFRTSKPISLMIRDISDQQITINPISGIKIFVLIMNKWAEVSNQMVYENGAFTLVPNLDSDPTKVGGISVFPDLTNYPTPSKVRIFLIGKLSGNQQNALEVASYIDVMLKP